MKRIIPILLIFALIISLCACGPKTAEEGYEKAKDLVNSKKVVGDWELSSGDFSRVKQSDGEYKYSYEVIFIATGPLSNAYASAQSATNSLYKRIDRAFGDHDVVIVFIFYSCLGHYMYGAIDGELMK